jgi:chorismate synthase
MSGNSFGDLFKVTTFGESHGDAIGCVIDGCPSGLKLDLSFIQSELDKRRPGKNQFVTPRSEKDQVQIISGVYDGIATGAPICLLIPNQDKDSLSYQPLKQLYRPGHANFTYLQKFGIFDHRGGGRASARETAARVAAGAIAQLILKEHGIEISAYLTQVGVLKVAKWDKIDSDIFCPDSQVEESIKNYLSKLILEGDSTGGIVTCFIHNVPSGLGEPVFDRFEAILAQAMLSIPATKGFEIGEGFESCVFKGSQFNDSFCLADNQISMKSNHAGGTLGGITSGQDIMFRTVFKPTSSIKKTQDTLSLDLKQVSFALDEKARHDPCVAVRGTVVVKAMAALVTCDMMLKSRLNRLNPCSL